MGDIDFINNVNTYPNREYDYTGYEKHTFAEGAVYGREGKLYTYESGEFKPYAENPKWEFNFAKYVKRYNIGRLDAVSILMGANDLQLATYENSAEKIAEYIKKYSDVYKRSA